VLTIENYDSNFTVNMFSLVGYEFEDLNITYGTSQTFQRTNVIQCSFIDINCSVFITIIDSRQSNSTTTMVFSDEVI